MEKLHNIYANCHNELSPQQKQQIESIDKVKYELMICAEERCRKTPMGNIPFTPEVNKAGKCCQLWRLVVAKREGKRRSSKNIHRIAKACGIRQPLSITLEQAQ